MMSPNRIHKAFSGHSLRVSDQNTEGVERKHLVASPLWFEGQKLPSGLHTSLETGSICWSKSSWLIIILPAGQLANNWPHGPRVPPGIQRQEGTSFARWGAQEGGLEGLDGVFSSPIGLAAENAGTRTRIISSKVLFI
ncbi:hypothetical protein ANO14919_092500 [Xylariales sp. No.14919]|nr:hypothetical protein ANO14919_092500 [Xylariales sp. No.14919]